LDEVRVFDPPDFRTKSHFEWSALPHFGSTMSKNGYCRSVPEISSNWKTAPQFDMQQVTGADATPTLKRRQVDPIDWVVDPGTDLGAAVVPLELLS
ncbi:unnamed protein product, partial [Cladocopium goreaui]